MQKFAKKLRIRFWRADRKSDLATRMALHKYGFVRNGETQRQRVCQVPRVLCQRIPGGDAAKSPRHSYGFQFMCHLHFSSLGRGMFCQRICLKAECSQFGTPCRGLTSVWAPRCAHHGGGIRVGDLRCRSAGVPSRGGRMVHERTNRLLSPDVPFFFSSATGFHLSFACALVAVPWISRYDFERASKNPTPVISILKSQISPTKENRPRDM